MSSLIVVVIYLFMHPFQTFSVLPLILLLSLSLLSSSLLSVFTSFCCFPLYFPSFCSFPLYFPFLSFCSFPLYVHSFSHSVLFLATFPLSLILFFSSLLSLFLSFCFFSSLLSRFLSFCSFPRYFPSFSHSFLFLILSLFLSF